MPRILIIEDDPGSAQLLKAVLTSVTHHIFWADSGTQGYQMAHEVEPTLIITDLRLPGGYSGWDLIELLRSDPGFNHVPIVVTSVEITYSDRQRAFDLGCDAYFGKPFDISELRTTIRALIGEAT